MGEFNNIFVVLPNEDDDCKEYEKMKILFGKFLKITFDYVKLKKNEKNYPFKNNNQE